jgi:acetyl esterase/lipase
METINGELASGTTAPAPHIACYLPTGASLGTGLVILPGGGYGGLAEHEGRGYAEYFAAAGIASFVVTYRLGTNDFRHPAMLEDALSAICAVRSRANEFGLDPQRIGIMGSSAGGHLASHALVAWDTYESAVSLRPDFGVLCYPVITSEGPFAHAGSMRNLAGEDPAPELLAELSTDRRVTAATPPCFLWHTGEDAGVPLENSVLFASALRTHGIPFELHLYARGRHGLGLGAPFDWGAECLRWIGELSESAG